MEKSSQQLKTLEKLEFLNRRTFAQLTSQCVGLQHKAKQEVE